MPIKTYKRLATNVIDTILSKEILERGQDEIITKSY